MSLSGYYGSSLKVDTVISLTTATGGNYYCSRNPGPWTCQRVSQPGSAINGGRIVTPDSLRWQVQQMFPGETNPPVSERTIDGFKAYCLSAEANAPAKGTSFCITTTGILAMSDTPLGGQMSIATLKSLEYTVNPADFNLPGPVTSH